MTRSHAWRHRFPIVGKGSGVWSFIHISDVASATVAAVEADVTGTFNVVDDEPAPVAAWLPELARAVGAKPPRRIPAFLARLEEYHVMALAAHYLQGFRWTKTSTAP